MVTWEEALSSAVTIRGTLLMYIQLHVYNRICLQYMYIIICIRLNYLLPCLLV